MTVELFGWLNKHDKTLAETPVSAERLGELVDLISNGTINGKIASEVFDNEVTKRLDKGFIGFQLHSGNEMVVAFKNIDLKR
jgi:Asp-tRNA(Asn)/Glu-tRNA(Gln) amidotransferase B subunit